jgi:hypothetical protein
MSLLYIVRGVMNDLMYVGCTIYCSSINQVQEVWYMAAGRKN